MGDFGDFADLPDLPDFADFPDFPDLGDLGDFGDFDDLPDLPDFADFAFGLFDDFFADFPFPLFPFRRIGEETARRTSRANAVFGSSIAAHRAIRNKSLISNSTLNLKRFLKLFKNLNYPNKKIGLFEFRKLLS